MKVIGLASPDELRVAFDACELDVLVDVLRDLRAKATRDTVETYATSVLGERVFELRAIAEAAELRPERGPVRPVLLARNVGDVGHPAGRVHPAHQAALVPVRPAPPDRGGILVPVHARPGRDVLQ
jgi:hypothetical protein